MNSRPRARIAVDIGGTFTDVALETDDGRLFTHKILTTPHAPADAVLDGIDAALADSGCVAGDIRLVLHGTTLATNAIIERRGARTALIVTEGFRDSVEMAYENRFAQYDINVDKPPPLVPRYLRLPVRERMSAAGTVVAPLDEETVHALIPQLDEHGVESVAIGLIHAYANPAHERRVAELVAAARPDLWITEAAAVCPEIREYERLSTACANAYVRPLMARYLDDLRTRLSEAGLAAPMLLTMSSGGLTTLETARRFPVRLVESGPAGGAIMACRIAAECDIAEALSFDMGGTTAKICLIDGAEAETARSFEVARAYRFTRGSGLPLRVPTIEMVEIGAGGGSVADVDALERVRVGPESAGADPGPACYGRGGDLATVTDADLLLGRLDANDFAGGAIRLDAGQAAAALDRAVAAPRAETPVAAAHAVSEVVEEAMAGAARVHAVERGKTLAGRTLIAFGGAAPLHAAALASKLGMSRVAVPAGAGVCSAIGFLRAPISYEVSRSLYMRLGAFEASRANALLAAMRAEAEAVVRLGAADAPLREARTASMRYVGQGHEIDVPLPNRAFEGSAAEALERAFADVYRAQYGREIPGVDIEIVNWSLTLRTEPAAPERHPTPAAVPAPAPGGFRRLHRDGDGSVEVPVHARAALSAGCEIDGPALIAEAQTTTAVPAGARARVDASGCIHISL